MADYLPPVVVELEGRHEKLLQSLATGKAEVRKAMAEIGKMKATANVQLKLGDGQIQKIQREIGRVKAQVTAKVDADTTKLEAKIKEAKGTKGELKVKLTIAPGEIEKIQKQIGRIKATVTIRTRLDPAEEVRTGDRLDRLARDRTVTYRPRVLGGSGGSGGSGRDSGVDWMGTLISLAPALAPIAASLTSVTLAAGAATIAVGAFGAAAMPQIKEFGALADAQGKVQKAVGKYGATSKQAAQAQQQFSQLLDGLPEPTKKAAAAYMVLTDDFKHWSDGLAKFTMKPVTQGLAVVDALLPKLSPLVKGVSEQFTRLTTLLGGAINTPGFDALMGRFTTFTNGVMKKAVDGVVHFARVLSEGRADGPMRQFLDYAHQVGPQVKETLTNLAKAVGNILKAASDAGPGILSLVNAVAKLVAALPSGFITVAMQAYTALKLISLTRSGLGGTTSAVSGLVTRISALRTVAQNAGGGLAGLRAAFSSLSAAGKASIIIGALAAVAAAISKLSDLGRSAPPNVDKLTTSLGELGRSGKTGGEALRVFGGNLDKFRDSVKAITAPSVVDHIQQGLVKVLSLGFADSTPKTEATQAFKAVDQSLADLVKNGNADLAAAALAHLTAAYAKGGHSTTAFTSKLKDYQSALDDAKLAQEITADSMGLFGQQAQATQEKLAAQKASADGLRQSIQALNDVNRSALDGQIGFEAAIDAATKAVKDNGKALSWKNGQLQLGSEKARNEAQALSDLAAKTDANTAAARDAGKSWTEVNGIYQRGRDQLIKVAQQMGLTKGQAKALADQILKTPDKTTVFRGDIKDLQDKLDAARAQLKSVPASKRASVLANIVDLENKIAQAKRDLAGVDGRTATTYVQTVYTFKGSKAKASLNADGSIRTAASGLGPTRQAMIAGAGSYILWAEDETGGEAYIPLARSKRKRSRKIAEETVKELGGAVAWQMADGGITPMASGGYGSRPHRPGPKRPTLEQLVPHLSGSSRAFASGTGSYANVSAGSRTQMVKDSKSLIADVGAALIKGVHGTTAQMLSAVKALQGAATKLLTNNMIAIVNRDNDKLKSLGKQRAALVKQLADAEARAHDRHATKSQRKAAAKRASDIEDRIRGIDKQEKGLRSEIARAKVIEKTGSAISKLIAADNAKLSGLAKQRDGVAAKLKAAQEKLAAVQQQWNEEKSRVSDSVMGGLTAVTAANDTGRPLNAADVLKSYQAQAQKAQQFAALLQQLKAKGLNASTLDQLSAAGVEGGYDSALALAGGTAGQIKQINSLQSQTKAAADKAGTAVADSMYGAGIKSAQGLVDGLKAQQKAIEAQMLAIATSMQAAIKKALGIKSPSRVMAELGQYTAQGLAVGINSGTKHAVVAARGLAMATAQAASLTGPGGLSLGPSTSQSGGGLTVHHHHVTVHVEGSVLSERNLVDVVERGMLRKGANRSVTYQGYSR